MPRAHRVLVRLHGVLPPSDLLYKNNIMQTQHTQVVKACSRVEQRDPTIASKPSCFMVQPGACKPSYHIYSRLITTVVETGRWLARPAAFSGFACCHSYRAHAAADHGLQFALHVVE